MNGGLEVTRARSNPNRVRDVAAELRAVEMNFLLSLFDFRGGGSYSMSGQTDRSLALARSSQATLGKLR
jgi:hypothetical protein